MENPNENTEAAERSKTLMILGLTFILPVILTFAAIYYFSR